MLSKSRVSIFFIILPFSDIGKNSFRVSDHYLGKNKKENSLTSWAWEVAYHRIMVNGEFLDDSLPKNELRKIDKEIQRKNIPLYPF